MGHFTGKDTLFSVYVAPVYKAISGIFDGADRHADTVSLPILPMIILLKLFYTRYAILEREISRQREMRADYIATLLYGAQNFRSALTKVVNFSTFFSSVWVRDYVATLKEGRIFKNYFSFFDSKINTEALGNEDFINDNSDAFSSHCSTRERFEYIPKIGINKQSINYDYEKYNKAEECLTEAMGYRVVGMMNVEHKNAKKEH